MSETTETKFPVDAWGREIRTVTTTRTEGYAWLRYAPKPPVMPSMSTETQGEGPRHE